MTGEFSFDLHCFSPGGGARVCADNCVIRFNLLMSGSLNIRLVKKKNKEETFSCKVATIVKITMLSETTFLRLKICKSS